MAGRCDANLGQLLTSNGRAIRAVVCPRPGGALPGTNLPPAGVLPGAAPAGAAPATGGHSTPRLGGALPGALSPSRRTFRQRAAQFLPPAPGAGKPGAAPPAGGAVSARRGGLPGAGKAGAVSSRRCIASGPVAPFHQQVAPFRPGRCDPPLRQARSRPAGAVPPAGALPPPGRAPFLHRLAGPLPAGATFWWRQSARPHSATA